MSQFNGRPTLAGGWEDMDLDQLRRDAQQLSSPLVRAALLKGIAAEEQRRASDKAAEAEELRYAE